MCTLPCSRNVPDGSKSAVCGRRAIFSEHRATCVESREAASCENPCRHWADSGRVRAKLARIESSPDSAGVGPSVSRFACENSEVGRLHAQLCCGSGPCPVLLRLRPDAGQVRPTSATCGRSQPILGRASELGQLRPTSVNLGGRRPHLRRCGPASNFAAFGPR